MLIAVEGLDGVGKTSTAKKLARMIGGAYFSKGFHLMRNTTSKYDNFTSISECLDTDSNMISEYSTRSTFLYCKQEKFDVVTDRYFCTNYAAKPDEKTIKEITLDISVLGIPDLTFILYCDPIKNYERMYNRDPNDKDFYKLKEHKSFYDNLVKCTKVFNFDYEFVDTTNLNLLQVTQLLSQKIAIHKVHNNGLTKLENININDNTLCIRNNNEINEISRKHFKLDQVYKLHISDALGYIPYAFIELLPDLKWIDVQQNNSQYTSYKGILFNHNMDKLICMPPQYELTEYILPVSVKRIGYSAFRNCKIESIVMNDSCCDVGYLAFCNCKNLKKLKFSDNITKIGNMAFVGCNPLLLVETGNSMFSFKDGTLLDSENNIVSALNTCIDQVTSNKIYAWAFARNSRIKNLIVPNLKRIGPYAFVDSSLESIIINSKVNIHDYAFWNCKRLSKIEFTTDLVPRIAHELFYNIGHTIKVIVPSHAINVYKDAFKNCINDVYFKGK